jgi:hypothetical protein
MPLADAAASGRDAGDGVNLTRVLSGWRGLGPGAQVLFSPAIFTVAVTVKTRAAVLMRKELAGVLVQASVTGQDFPRPPGSMTKLPVQLLPGQVIRGHRRPADPGRPSPTTGRTPCAAAPPGPPVLASAWLPLRITPRRSILRIRDHASRCRHGPQQT